ncbi:MAG: hypothetical protein FWF10_03830 [Clostridiales bacterium]|nr:hypothetical protein [Clostridiales bacterium]
MLVSLSVALLFALSGLCVAALIFAKQKLLVRVWLGLVLGLLCWTWLPSLFSFIFGFALLSNALGLGAALAGGAVCLFFAIRKGLIGNIKLRPVSVPVLLTLIGILLLCAALFHTHIILPKGGALYVGQTTYGDLAMHLGFISSIARQGVFPPEYSIFPGYAINYPFLCETSSATLMVFGAGLRTAYLVPALYACVLVILGVYFFFEQWLKKPKRAAFATALFFLGSGFGFLYFIDLAKAGGAINGLLGENKTALAYILDGFYQTPTNLPTVGLRWVNPIVDMMVPQRATLFGWAFLFPCLYLLHGFRFKNERRNVLPLAVIAGAMPMIHTHSFLALGVLSAVYLAQDACSREGRKRLLHWLLFGGLAVLLAAPQLVIFTFRQAAEGSMLRMHFNWANNADSFLWFYIKNLGWLFLLLPFGYLLLSRRDREILLAPLLLWALAEFVQFQPNEYDNNKLLFVWFAFLCGLAARFLAHARLRARVAIHKRSTVSERQGALYKAVALLSVLLLGSVIAPIMANLRGGDGFANIPFRQSGFVTILFLVGLLLFLLSTPLRRHKRAEDFIFPLLHAGGIGYLLYLLYEQYRNAALFLHGRACLILCLLFAATFVFALMQVLEKRPRASRGRGSAGTFVALQVGSFVLLITLFLGGILTNARELKSEYQAFGADAVAAAAYIDQNTEPNAMFLTDDSWHLNPVAVLTGRNIVCGTGTFLYFHGMDTAEMDLRRAQVREMLENPAESGAWFALYGVDYVYIGSSERMRFACDIEYFDAHFTRVFQNDEAVIYKVP